jgi:hypothetical protein
MLGGEEEAHDRFGPARPQTLAVEGEDVPLEARKPHVEKY